MIDFETADFAQHPDKILSELRKLDGLYHHQLPGGPKVWLITHREHAEYILTNENYKVSPVLPDQSYANNPFSEVIPKPLHLLAVDDDMHRRLRAPLTHFFSPKKLETHRPFIQQTALKILKEWKKDDQREIAKDFSYAIPVRVISHLLGLEWNDHLPAYAMALQLVKSDPTYAPEVATFHQILKKQIAENKQTPNESMISEMIRSGLSDEEVLNMSLLCFIAGSGTTASLISQGIHMGIVEKNDLDATHSVPSSFIVDQVLQKTPPANSAFPRYAHEPDVVHGTKIERGDIVMVILASANYDHKINEDPLKNYLSFSRGIHHCIGAYLAKMQATIAIEEFFKAYPDAELIHKKWFGNLVSRDLMELEVRL